MEQLDQIFSRDDIEKLIEYADGRHTNDFECEVVTFDLDKIKDLKETEKVLFNIDHGAEQELIVSFGKSDEENFYNYQLIIRSNGDIAYMNYSGCRFRFNQPLEVYELVLDIFKKLKG